MGLILNNYFFGRGDTSCNVGGACRAMNSNSFVTATGNSADDEKSVPNSNLMEGLRCIAKIINRASVARVRSSAYSGQ